MPKYPFTRCRAVSPPPPGDDCVTDLTCWRIWRTGSTIRVTWGNVVLKICAICRSIVCQPLSQALVVYGQIDNEQHCCGKGPERRLRSGACAAGPGFFSNRKGPRRKFSPAEDCPPHMASASAWPNPPCPTLGHGESRRQGRPIGPAIRAGRKWCLPPAAGPALRRRS